MKHVRIRMRWWLAGSIGVAAILSTFGFAALSSGASASLTTHQHVRPPSRPHGLIWAGRNAALTSNPVVAFTQEFQKNTQPFCPPGSGNNPCDGAYNGGGSAQDYGTIDRMPGGFSNGGYGNYAPSTPALTGAWMALVSGDQDGNQGAGCPGTAVEECTGPYALFGTGAAQGAENVFPGGGFTVTDDLYLSPATAANGALIDDDVELNNSSGGYGIDNVITACPESGAFVINFGHSSPGSCSGAPAITSAGWYRFAFVFSNVAGNAYLTMNVVSEASPTSIIATSTPQPVGGTATPTTDWGGPGYFWLPTENISGVPLANFALQLGQHKDGHTP
jgi:hypothetical protein